MTRRRVVRKTTLIYGEGSDDKCWLNYLKGIFAGEKTIRIKNGGGGSPDSVIEKMTRDLGFNEYDVKIALLDTDRDEFAKAEELAEKHNIKIIASTGCLELEMLSLMHIINPRMVSSTVLSRARTNSHQAKAEFEKVCKHDSKDYVKFFPKNVLESVRSRSVWLDEILTELENA